MTTVAGTCSDFGFPTGARLTWQIPSYAIDDSFEFNFTLTGTDDGIDCREITVAVAPTKSSSPQHRFVQISFPSFDYGRPAWGCQYGTTGGCCDYLNQCQYQECRDCDNGGKRWVSIVGSDGDVCYRDQRHICGTSDGVTEGMVSPHLAMQAFVLPVQLTVVSAPSTTHYKFDRPTEGSFTVRVTHIDPPTPAPTPLPTTAAPTRLRYSNELCDYASLGVGTGCTGFSTKYDVYNKRVSIYPAYDSDYNHLGESNTAAEYCEEYCNNHHDCMGYVAKYIGTSGNLFQILCWISTEVPTSSSDDESGHQVAECMQKLVDTCRPRPASAMPLPTPTPIDVGEEAGGTESCSGCLDMGCEWCQDGVSGDSVSFCLCDGRMDGVYYGACGEYSAGSEAVLSCGGSEGLGIGALLGIVSAALVLTCLGAAWLRRKFVVPPSTTKNVPAGPTNASSVAGNNEETRTAGPFERVWKTESGGDVRTFSPATETTVPPELSNVLQNVFQSVANHNADSPYAGASAPPGELCDDH